MKKVVYIKEVDRIYFSANNKDCFGQSWDNEEVLLLERLKMLYEVRYSDDPDIVLAYVPNEQVRGYDYGKYRDKILLHWIAESIYPDFNAYDYIISAWHNIQIPNRYLYIPYSVLCCNLTRESYDLMRIKHKIKDEYELLDRDFCSFTVSNGYFAGKEREEFFKLLSLYKKVDSGGGFLNNIGYRVSDKLAFDHKHKFSIVFENSKNSFITEKIDMAFAGQTIPIYWGNSNISDIYNANAFVNCHDYDSFEEVVERIKEIDNDNDLYLAMLREPALLMDRPKEYYINQLDDFLINIVEKGERFRWNYGWSERMQEVRIAGMKKLYRKKNIKSLFLRIARIIGYPVRKTKIILKIKDRIYRHI